MKAVIDRFEENYAVVLFGDDETEVNIPRKLVPSDAEEGDWLNITFKLDPEETKKQKEKITKMLDKLKNKTERGE